MANKLQTKVPNLFSHMILIFLFNSGPIYLSILSSFLRIEVQIMKTVLKDIKINRLCNYNLRVFALSRKLKKSFWIHWYIRICSSKNGGSGPQSALLGKHSKLRKKQGPCWNFKRVGSINLFPQNFRCYSNKATEKTKPVHALQLW